MYKLKFVIFAALLGLFFVPGYVAAKESLTIDIDGPGEYRVNLAILRQVPLPPYLGLPAHAGLFLEHVEKNLQLLPFVHLLADRQVLGGTATEGVLARHLDFKRLQVSKVDLVMTIGWEAEKSGQSRVEVRVFETYSGRLVVGKAYRVKNNTVPRAADMFCAHFMDAIIGNGNFFRSVLAFSRKTSTSREIWTITPQGRNLRQVTFLGRTNISPAWSANGRFLSFTHLGSSTHSIGIWDKQKNSIFRTTLPGTSIAGSSFSADGRLVVALSRGNMEIFKLTPDFNRIAETLIKSWAIDVSPSIDYGGEYMAFTSDRSGNPHIYIKNLKTGEEKRLTHNGKYNTSPSISQDGKIVTYSRRTPEGHRIFVSDRENSFERQISFGPGSDEEPAFSPDGYFIVFSSNRSGEYKLYLTTRHGNEARLINTGPGDATHPAFGQRG